MEAAKWHSRSVRVRRGPGLLGLALALGALEGRGMCPVCVGERRGDLVNASAQEEEREERRDQAAVALGELKSSDTATAKVVNAGLLRG